MSKIFKPFIKLFQLIYKIIDKLIVTPISRIIYKINEFSRDNAGRIEKILNRPNILIYVSLACAVALFVLVDSQVLNLSEKNAEVIEGQKVNVTYNKEAYVVEGVPENVDITLIGSKSTVYLATQLGKHEVELDLSKYSAGTYKVKLKYNHTVQSVDYRLEPSTVTVKISEKISATRALTYDLMNENKLDAKLSISNVTLDTNEVVIKSSQEIIDKVAVVKALVDASQIDLKESGEYTMDKVALLAYDSNGNKVDNIDIVPSKVSAKITIDSYHAVKPVKVVTDGTMNNGKAIGSITTSVKEVTVYGDKEEVDKLAYIEAPISVNKLDADKNMAVTLTKPSGIRFMSDTSTNVTISVGIAAQKTVGDVIVHTEGLADNLTANALSIEDQKIEVICQGVQSIIDSDATDASNIHASVDLSNLGVGTHEVELKVTIDDERVIVKPTKTKINVKIVQK